MKTKFRTGVLFGDEVTELLHDANNNKYAIPAVNVIGTNSVNACMETARAVNSPIIIQFSNGVLLLCRQRIGQYRPKAAVLGAVSGALHIHQLAEAYGVTVVLHTDHCAKTSCPGWMVCWMPMNDILKKMVMPCSVPTCSISAKSPLWKTSK